MISSFTIGQKIAYFLITVVFFGGTGIWLPLAIDYFPNQTLSLEVKHGIVSNFQTFYLGLFFVAGIDRLLYLISDETYKHKLNEVFISFFILIIFGILTYFVFQYMHNGSYKIALVYALVATLIAFGVWWRANHNPKPSAYGALGGQNV